MSDGARQVPADIRDDTPCVHCGYNLRGLDPSGRCPECGQAIQIVEQGELLLFADAGWLDRLRLGAGLKLAAIAISILFGLLSAAIVGGAMVVFTIVILILGLLGRLGAPFAPATFGTSTPGVAIPTAVPVPAGTPPATAATSGGWGTVLTFLGCFGGLAGLVLFLWYVRLLFKYRGRFREAAEHSRVHAVAANQTDRT